MKILKSKEDLFEKIRLLIEQAEYEIVLFSPYISCKALKKLLIPFRKNLNISIITSWKPADILMGSSDIEVFLFCKDNNIPLLINNNIHLKVIATDKMQRAYIGSANITGSGLGIGNNYNIETGIINENLHLDDKIYLDNIIQDSNQVDDEYYIKIKNELKKIDKPKIPQKIDVKFSNKKNFLLSSLPMSENVGEVYNVYCSEKVSKIPEENVRSAHHDIKLYNIPNNLNKDEFMKILKNNFLNHPFIKAYTKFIDKEKYFGEISSWLHNQVTNVPTPRRYDIKKTQKRVNNFLLELNDNYSIDVPGRQSMRIFKK